MNFILERELEPLATIEEITGFRALPEWRPVTLLEPWGKRCLVQFPNREIEIMCRYEDGWRDDSGSAIPDGFDQPIVWMDMESIR